MTEIILHQYAESPFSEKVRALLGYKGASYKMVEIPVIMPRPDVIPLTGGYRKTPVMQIGADIYCDSAKICQVIDELYPEQSINPNGRDSIMAFWTDTFLFKVAVAVAFQPKAAASNPLFADEAAITAFMADRAELTQGSTELQMDLGIAEPHFLAHLDKLDLMLEESAFIGGESPSIADFSTFHVCWFINRRDVLREMFDPFRHVIAWYDRMSDFGNGQFEVIGGSEAIEVARSTEPAEISDAIFLEDLSTGMEVEVMPIDYGFQPVRGELLCAGLDEIAVARTDDIVGRVVVHFPRTGFQVRATAA